ncbi:MAG: spore coat protein CotJB [Clostridia bacterium]|nr:spore coat protein CotJB [Clostridia bacterium]
MDLNREKLLREVMAADFTVIDLQLYLDTHPCDQKALALYNSGVQQAKMLKENYERQYGPLTALWSYSGYPWQWIQSPWPWEG